MVDKFYYPRLGAGMLWEKFEEYIIKHNIEVSKNMKVTQVKESGEHYIVSYEDAEGKSQSIETKNIFPRFFN